MNVEGSLNFRVQSLKMTIVTERYNIQNGSLKYMHYSARVFLSLGLCTAEWFLDSRKQ